ncbi:TPM domain-containing protein [Halomonas nitroreducens]|uniref:TPM domain-containing protein n=1 Tax=Halomonas nitroreducens TaxID=447425 RepID=A0A3S0JV33_9GAMM|nr:TPM domain-containing protein [Halomonas nitroreducens]RTR01463.1 TPM domain-containing protein [Halomonas nitroreducens]
MIDLPGANGLLVGLGLLLLSWRLARSGLRLPGWLAVLAGVLVVGGLWWAGGPERTADSLARVEDRIDLLDEAERQRLAEYHAFLAADHDIDYRVVIDRELGDLDRFAVDYVRRHGVGGDQGRGLLLALDVSADQVRLEVGYGLEGQFVDAFVAYLEARQMTEFFTVGRVADGILASTELIVAQAQRVEGDLVPAIAGSGGAGARLPARLGEGRAMPREAQVTFAEGGSPRDVLAAYRRAMAERNDNPELVIYSLATRKMLVDWVMTPAQMDTMARSLADCPVARELTDVGKRRAVLLAPLAERQCPPYFLVQEKGVWRLDLDTMMQAVRFGRDNSWRLEREALGPYGFGFVGIRFDSRGFPQTP